MPYQFPKVNWEAFEATGNMAFKYSDAAEKLGSLARRSSRVAGVGTLIEIATAVYGIHQAYKQWTGDENQPGGILIESREEFIWKVVEIVTTSTARWGFSAGGAVVGQALIPIPIVGAVVGVFLGSIFGHIASKALFNSY